MEHLHRSVELKITAQIYLHRYLFIAKTFPNKHIRLLTYAAVTLLAAKVTEQSIKSIKLTQAFCLLCSQSMPKSYPKSQINNAFLDLTASEIDQQEAILLDTIGFNLEIDLPFASLETFKSVLEVSSDKPKEVVQSVYGCLNDAYKLPLCLNYTANQIAAACVFFVSNALNLNLFTAGKDWHLQFGQEVKTESVSEICDILKNFFKAYVDNKLTVLRENPIFKKFGSPVTRL